MTAAAVVAGLALGVGLPLTAWQARLALLAYLEHLGKQNQPPAEVPEDGAVELRRRLEALEGDVARVKVERLTGRR